MNCLKIHERKYYISGKKISRDRLDKILAGKTGKLIRCPDGQPSIPLATFCDCFRVKGNQIDKNDSILVAYLREVGLPLEKTLIVQIYSDPEKDPLSHNCKGAIYGYW